MMNKSVFLAIILLVLPCGYSATSNDAVNLVANSNAYLYSGETYIPPNVPVEFEGKDYWVVPVADGSNIVVFFAVDVSSGELSTSRAVNRGLFETSDRLRELQSLKNSISSNQGLEWLLTQKYQSVFDEMSRNLDDEFFQINAVETSLDNEGFSVNLASLKNRLKSMSATALELSSLVIESANKENVFFTKPSPESFSEFKGSFDDVYSLLNELNSENLTYQSEVDKLRLQISTADIDPQTKVSLSSVLELPQSLKAVRNYNLNATQMNDLIESSLQTVSLRQDSLLDEFDSRLLKNEVHSLIYEENSVLEKKTGFADLTTAKSTILANGNRLLWTNQTSVRSLELNYSRAVKFYTEKNFSNAKDFALQAIDNVVSIEKDGKKTETIPELISQDFLFLIAGVLAILLILLYFLNNTGKIKGALAPQTEELDLYEK